MQSKVLGLCYVLGVSGGGQELQLPVPVIDRTPMRDLQDEGPLVSLVPTLRTGPGVDLPSHEDRPGSPRGRSAR